MTAATPTTLRLDEPIYDQVSREWHFPIFDSDTGRTVGRGAPSRDRSVAKINAKQQIERLAKAKEAGR
jgi:hypothetical protein